MVLVCADSWYPQSFAAVKATKTDLVLVPSFSSPRPDWNRPWLGYNGFPTPEDVSIQDVKSISLADAWKKYSLAGRLKSSDARIGAMCYEVGNVWDMEADGQSYICDKHALLQQLPAAADDVLLHPL